MNDARSRAILLTPPGGAAIAVIRLAGPGVGDFLAARFSKTARDGRCVHGEISDGGRVLDDPVVVLSGNRTIADLNLHGGPWVVRSVMELAKRAGFDLVENAAGPIHADAVDAASEIEREILTHLPLARTELAVRVLLAQADAWERLRFPLDPDAARAMLADESMRRLLHPPRVAIIGPANVGKSTLANQLFAQERSITADLPGTTRDWVGEIADVNGLAVMLVDTPGVRLTADPIERAAIAMGRAQAEAADLVVLVLDASRPLWPEQGALLAAHPQALRVINKSDRPARWSLPATGARDALPTVATTGAGVDALRRAIAAAFGCDGIQLDKPRWWTSRQRAELVGLSSRADPQHPPDVE